MAICINWHPFYSLNNHQGPWNFIAHVGFLEVASVFHQRSRLFVSPFSPSKTFDEATARLEGMETLPKTWILNQLQYRAWLSAREATKKAKAFTRFGGG